MAQQSPKKPQAKPTGGARGTTRTRDGKPHIRGVARPRPSLRSKSLNTDIKAAFQKNPSHLIDKNIKDPNISDQELIDIIESDCLNGEYQTSLEILTRDYISSKLFEKLAVFPHEYVRTTTVSRLDCPYYILAERIYDSNEDEVVINAIIDRQDFLWLKGTEKYGGKDSQLVDYLANHSYFGYRRKVASLPNLPKSIIEKMLEAEYDPDFREELVEIFDL